MIRHRDAPPSAPHTQHDGGEFRDSSRGAWRTWLAVGATGFGGPAGQVAILHRETVERRRWLDEEEFLAALRICTLLPGPEAQQLATYAGWRIGGTVGGLVAGTLFILPGAILVTFLAWIHSVGRSVPLVSAAFAGVRPAVVVLVAMAAWRVARKSIGSPTLGLLAIASGAALLGGMAFPLIVAICFVVGWLLPSVGAGSARGHERDAATHGANRRPLVAVLRHAIGVTVVALVVWSICYAAVTAAVWAGGRGPAIATLFTETTLLSFGGAYAVVPWALDEALARGWLESDEQFAALAMGEATPGPLILVVTFIGFLAGAKAAAVSVTAGIEGAATATLFAFLPSFAMILALAPAVRSIRPGSRLGRGLAAVGAAVVATITLLACRLAAEAFLPDAALDGGAVVVSALAAAALSIGRIPTPVVVAAAAALGVLRAAS